MPAGFFSRIFGERKLDLDSIRAELRRIEQDLRENFDADAFRNGDWFLQNFERFVERYRKFDRIRSLENAHPEMDESQLADLLCRDAIKTATFTGGTAGVAVSVAELSGFMTAGISWTVGGLSAIAEMVYLVNLQLQLTFDIATLNGISISSEEPDEMLLVFATALGSKNLDLHGDGDISEVYNLVKAAGSHQLYKYVSKWIGYQIIKKTIAMVALPVLNIGVGAYLSHRMTKGVGKVSKDRFEKLRRMKERLFDLRPRLTGRQAEVLLLVMGCLQSDGFLTLEEIFLLRELARSLNASTTWQQILTGELEFESGEFIQKFRDPANFEHREILLGVLQIVSETKLQPNEKEAAFIQKLVFS